MMALTIGEHNKDLLLASLFHHMDMDLRHKIMTEVPQAYNAYVMAQGGDRVLKVVYNDGENTEVKRGS